RTRSTDVRNPQKALPECIRLGTRLERPRIYRKFNFRHWLCGTEIICVRCVSGKGTLRICGDTPPCGDTGVAEKKESHYHRHRQSGTRNAKRYRVECARTTAHRFARRENT